MYAFIIPYLVLKCVCAKGLHNPEIGFGADGGGANGRGSDGGRAGRAAGGA
jgi:hypothetical protein